MIDAEKATAQYYGSSDPKEVGENVFLSHLKMLEEIQLDAFKAGIKYAANIPVTYCNALQYVAGGDAANICMTIAERIERASDEVKAI